MNDQPRSRLRRVLAGLGITTILMLMLLLVIGQFQQPAYSQDLSSSPADSPPVSIEATPTRVPCPSAPTPTPAPPGLRVELYADEEVLLSFRQANDQKAMANSIINNTLNTTQLAIAWPEVWWTAHPNLANVSWIASTTGDLNGDGQPEQISAFKNSSS